MAKSPTRTEAVEEMRSHHLDVVDRLARIETHIDGFAKRLEDHAVADAKQFARIDRHLDSVTVDLAVAKAVGGREGRKRGLRWGTAVSALVVLIAEATRALGWMR